MDKFGYLKDFWKMSDHFAKFVSTKNSMKTNFSKASSSNLRSAELKEFHSSDNPILTMTDLFGVV